MSKTNIRYPRSAKVFIAVALLILAQVAWWTVMFNQDVNTIASLRIENMHLRAQITQGSSLDQEAIQKAALHRRFMFFSESITFALLTVVGLYLLMHALRAEAHSREIQRNFIEIVTHESKTPLTALKLRLESLLEKNPHDAELRRGISSALTEVRRLSSTFEKVLNWNRLERQAYQKEVFDLSLAVDEVVRRLEPFFEEKGAICRLEIDADLMVKGDAAGIQSSIQALLENAVLYNDKPEKEVVIKLKRGLETISLVVEDNGPGIALSEREKVFDRFYRGKNGKRAPGTGLGLQIARQIAEAHFGVLHYKEPSQKSGAAFEMILPVGELA